MPYPLCLHSTPVESPSPLAVGRTGGTGLITLTPAQLNRSVSLPLGSVSCVKPTLKSGTGFRRMIIIAVASSCLAENAGRIIYLQDSAGYRYMK